MICIKKKIVLSLIVTMFIWGLFSWPLAKIFFNGIPSSAHNIEQQSKREMIAGDHLQFLYHFWLFKDMLVKKTPWGYNLYEFNQGDDSKCYKPGFYYFPFSFVFAISSFLGGNSFGYNVNGFITIWLTLLFTWILLSRFSKDNLICFFAAVISIMVPYRWSTFLGGSPTGLAMVFIPMLFYFFDKAIRDNSLIASFCAGICILFSYFTDTHVFFFAVLSLPFMSIISFIYNKEFQFNNLRSYFILFKNSIPFFLISGLAVFLSLFFNKDLSDSMMASGRTLREIALYSPSWKGLISFSKMGFSSDIYVGWGIFLLILTGFYFLIKTYLLDKKLRHLLIFSFFILCLAIILLLSLGSNSPFEALPLRFVRKVIEPYKMIRQPAKIFCLLPLIISFLFLFSIQSICLKIQSNARKNILILVLFILIGVDYKYKVNATISILPKKQQAYKTVKHDAFKCNKPLRALAVPLWPGDSSWSSLYEYYSMLYRVKMLNGYSPVVSKKYFDNIFRQYETVNKGIVNDNQLNELIKMGINYILFHEDSFPEKVSPFSSFVTLKNLLNHPRLEFLSQADSVWSFKIKNTPLQKEQKFSDITQYASAIHYEVERCYLENVAVKNDDSASSGSYVFLHQNNSLVKTRPFHMVFEPNSSFYLRARGKGEILITQYLAEDILKTDKIVLEDNNWKWYQIKIPEFKKYAQLSLNFSLMKGKVDLDYLFLSTAISLTRDNSKFQAVQLFHSGFSDFDKMGVTFLREQVFAPKLKYQKRSFQRLRGSQSAVLYGPRLPFVPGKYKLKFNFLSKARYKTLLGAYHVRNGSKLIAYKPVYAGLDASVEIDVLDNLPVTLYFIFSGNADMSIFDISFIKK